MKKLTDLHHRAMMLRGLGKTYAEIGAEIHRAETTVAHWFALDPLFRDTFTALQADAIERARMILTNAAPDAARNILDLQQHKVGVVRLGASKDILDRVGLQPVQKHDLTSGSEPVRFTIKIAGRRDDDDQDEPGD